MVIGKRNVSDPCPEVLTAPLFRWAWPVSWGFLCGAVASASSAWPDRWKASAFILWFLADPASAALAHSIWASRWAWHNACFEQAGALRGRLGAFWRAFYLAEGAAGRAVIWAIIALVAALVLVSRQGWRAQQLFLFLAGSVVLISMVDQGPTLPLTAGLRVAWAWFLGHWAFDSPSPFYYGLSMLAGVGVAASLLGKREQTLGAKWLGRIAGWSAVLWLLWMHQPFLGAMAAALALNWEALFAGDAPRSPRAVWRLAWLGLGMMIAIVQAGRTV